MRFTSSTVVRHTSLALATALGAATLAFAVVPTASATTTPAASPSASATATPSVPGQWRERLELVCTRLPNAIARTERLTQRLAGDVETRGSLLWLADKADMAREAGREDLATALDNRLQVRTQLADLLPQRLAALEQAQVSCDEADL